MESAYIDPSNMPTTRSTLMTRPHTIFVLTALTMISQNCLPSDPRTEDEVARDSKASSTVSHPSTAPAAIDSAVLTRRLFKEAPQFAALVQSGRLPPVSERLPREPLVIRPIQEIGTYGGTIRRALTGDIAQTPGPSKTMVENLMAYSKPMPDSLELCLAQSYTFSDSGRTAVFELRHGLKWSDGHPFTVDDILFFYNDMVMNPSAREGRSPPAGWHVDGKPIVFEKLSDTTLRVSATKPMGRLLHQFARELMAIPKHVLAHLHPRYNPEASYETLQDSTTSAMKLFSPGFPTMSAWMPVEWIRGERIVFERNPYYWKIDTEGNQLPYADRIVFNVIQDTQVILLKFINEELDLFGRYTRIDMYPVLKAEEKKGRFKLRVTGPNRGPTYHLNWDAPNPNLREAFRDKRVRMALSHGVNREEISQIVFYGLLEPSGYSFGPLSPYYDPDAYQKYAWYDPQHANQLLDEAGYMDRDGDGYREFKDGSIFQVTIDYVHPGGFFNGGPVSEILADHWRDIGIKVHLNGALRNIIVPRRYNNEFEIHYWGLEGPNDPLTYAIGWGILGTNVPYWHQNASKEGPEWLWEATREIKAAIATTDPAKLRRHMNRVRDLHTENIPLITIGSIYNVWGANSRLGNVPETNVADNAFLGWSRPVYHEQIFIRPQSGGIGDPN
jgi:peptide/nickel transport system substrate-binding protein